MHSVCPLCRTCTRAEPCERCMAFTPAQWSEVQTWLQGRRDKLLGRIDAIPNPLALAGPSGTSVPPRPVKSKAKSKSKGKEKASAKGAAGKKKKSALPGGGASGSVAVANAGGNPSSEGCTTQARDSVASAPERGAVLRDAEPALEESILPRVSVAGAASTSHPPLEARRTEGSGSQAQGLAPEDSSAPRSRESGGTRGGSGSRNRSQDLGPGSLSVGPGASAPAGTGTGSEAAASVPERQDTREGSSRRQYSRESSGNQERGGERRDHRSRSPSRSGFRRRSSSGSPESDSDAGYRRERRHRRTRRVSPAGFPDPSDPGWVSQLAGILGPLIAGEVAKQTAHLLPSSSDQAPLPPPTLAGETVTLGAAGDTPPPDALELLASDEFDEVSEGEEEWPEETAPTETEEEDRSPRGTELPPALLASVTEILISKLGYEAPASSGPGPSGSRLCATNEEQVSGPPEFPVDEHCQKRLETLAEKHPWTAFPSFQERAVRVAEGHWETLFKPPSVSDETRNKVRSEQGLASGMFREPLRKKAEEDWYQADLAARAGLKFSSVFLMAAEALRRAHLQVPEDPIQYTRADVGNLVYLLGPLSRLVYDQFARVALKSVHVRRENILDAFAWPSSEARGRLEHLPVVGSDLFNGQFLEKLVEEVKRHEETAAASFKSPPTKPTSIPPARPAASRGRQRPSRRVRKARGGGRGGTSGRPSTPGRGRGGRGGVPPARGRGRGASGAAERPKYVQQAPKQFPPRP